MPSEISPDLKGEPSEPERQKQDIADAVHSKNAVTAVLHQSEEGGYWCSVPVIPGCYSQGDTWEEACEMIVDALEGIVAHLAETAEADMEQILDPDVRSAVKAGQTLLVFFAEQDDTRWVETRRRAEQF